MHANHQHKTVKHHYSNCMQRSVWLEMNTQPVSTLVNVKSDGAKVQNI